MRRKKADPKPARGILCGNLQENAGPQFRGARFVRACAVEMHMDISEEPFYAVIYRNNAGPVCRARHAHLD